MSVEVTWYQHDFIIHIKYQGDITVEGIRESLNAAENLVASSSGKQHHSIIEMHNIKKFPRTMKDLKEIIIDARALSDGGIAVFVGASGVVSFITNLAAQLMSMPFYMVKNMDEAAAIFNRLDELKTS